MRARGFTLVEMMISLALAGLVVAGALQLHSSYNSHIQRQNQIAEIQQTLRIAMAVIARTVRNAGTGMAPTSDDTTGARFTFMTFSCTGLNNVYYPFQYSNSNTFTNPKTTGISTDPGAPGNDTDPDWFKVIAAVDEQAMVGAGGTTATFPVSLVGSFPTTTLTGWAANQLLLFPSANFGTPGCMKRVASVASNVVTFDAPCTGTAPCDGTFVPTASRIVKRFDATSETVFRIFPAGTGSGTSGTTTPRLAMARGLPNGVSLAGSTWVPIADHVEDLQIALVYANGAVVNRLDDPTISRGDPWRVSAVRVTLVGRSPTEVPGITGSQVGGYEDRPASTTTDGFIRRALTEEIELRN